MLLPQFGQPHDGLLIALDGPEGAGKTTLAQSLVKQLKSQWVRAQYVKEPGDMTSLGRTIRASLLKVGQDLSPTVEFLLLAASRAEQMAFIGQCLARGEVVVSDRCFLSSYAYQGGEDERLVELMHRIHQHILPYAYDLVMVVDVDDAVSVDRQVQRGTSDRIEERGVAYHQRVNGRFRQMARDNGYPVINGNLSPEEVLGVVYELVEPLLER